MTAGEIRKPREFWLEHHERWEISLRDNNYSGETIHVREIIPGDDSIRVSREAWNLLVEHMDFEEFNSAASLIQRIERESKGESHD